MMTARFNHCCVYDEKRGRIYCIGGVNEDSGSIASTTDMEKNRTSTCEYYDIRND